MNKRVPKATLTWTTPEGEEFSKTLYNLEVYAFFSIFRPRQSTDGEWQELDFTGLAGFQVFGYHDEQSPLLPDALDLINAQCGTTFEHPTTAVSAGASATVRPLTGDERAELLALSAEMQAHGKD